MRLTRAMPLLLGLMTAPAGAGAQTPGGVSVVIDGAVAQGGMLDAGHLAQMPQQNLTVTYGTGGGVRSGRYGGVLLWDLLRQAVPIDQPVKNPGLRHSVMVTGRDGYAVVFSFGELDPGGSADPVLLATAHGALQLLVPGDRTGGRDVHDVVRISVQ